MEYFDNVDKASELARLALPLMAKHKLPANPVNFSVCYEYVSGCNAELQTAMGQLLREDYTPSEEDMIHMFQTYVMPDEISAVEDAQAQLQVLLSNTLEQLSGLGGNISNYSELVNEASTQMGNELDVSKIGSLFSNLIAETSEMAASSKTMEQQLQASVQEAEALRENLHQVRQEAAKDSLTGLANRGTFDTALSDAIQDAHKSGQNLSLIMLDIDHFKNFNDTYGHLIGDKVIQFVASIIKKNIKGQDTGARYGGEEYAVILPQTSVKGAQKLAEKLRTSIASAKLKRAGSGESLGTLTVSLGVAGLTHSDDPKHLISRADSALYLSKKNGRNRVSMESELPLDAVG